MKRFIAGEDRRQATLLPDCLDDYVSADNPVRLVEVFADDLDLSALGFAGSVPEATGRPAYHPATLLKIYLYGYPPRLRHHQKAARAVRLRDHGRAAGMPAALRHPRARSLRAAGPPPHRPGAGACRGVHRHGDRARGRLSLALGTAMQFETALRQKDVIGEWEPIPAGEMPSGILLNGRRWTVGLTWADLSADLVVRKATTKTGAFAAHDLKLCPLVVTLLD